MSIIIVHLLTSPLLNNILRSGPDFSKQTSTYHIENVFFPRRDLYHVCIRFHPLQRRLDNPGKL